jgi:predicted PhzF superfamily epimerase YddE/YHI9
MVVVPASELIRCLHGDESKASSLMNGEGGLARVHWCPDVPATKLSARAEMLLGGHEHRDHVAVLLAGAMGHYVAESYAPDGRRIQFCGHGALAAAWVALQELEPDAQSIAFRNEQFSWQARRDDSAAGCIVLAYPRPPQVACAVPEFSATCLGDQPVAAAMVGGESDYLILELASAQAVQELQPDFLAIVAATERALIVTAAQTFATGSGDKLGCVFRYFAPQYGNPEDAATGSAAVQLAAYWSPRINVANFLAHQLSPQGAWMQLGCHANTVELAGRVGYG